MTKDSNQLLSIILQCKFVRIRQKLSSLQRHYIAVHNVVAHLNTPSFLMLRAPRLGIDVFILIQLCSVPFSDQ